MKLRILMTLVVLGLIAGVVWRTQQHDAGDTKKAEMGKRPLTVKTVPVEVRDFPRVLELPGTVEAARQVAIVPQASGTLMRVGVQEGDAVRAGQLLFVLDARAAQARIAQSQATLTGASAEMAEAEKKRTRLAPLMKSGYISQQEFDDALIAVEAARAKAGVARAERESAQLDVSYAQLRAPIAGRVGRIDVRVGSLVQAGGAALTTIIAPGALDVRASVAQQDWPALAAARANGSVGAEVAQGVAAIVRGELVFADAQIDAATGAVPIKVRLTEASPGWLSGQNVRVRLMLGVEPDARVIPEAALQHAQDGAYVYVVRQGKAVIQKVNLLRSLDGKLAVSGALQAGEPVLIEIPQRLKAGGAVKLEGARAAGSKPGRAE